MANGGPREAYLGFEIQMQPKNKDPNDRSKDITLFWGKTANGGWRIDMSKDGMSGDVLGPYSAASIDRDYNNPSLKLRNSKKLEDVINLILPLIEKKLNEELSKTRTRNAGKSATEDLFGK